MKTQQEYMKEIKTLFRSNIMSNSSIFDAYCHRDDRADTYIKYFKNEVEQLLGLKFSNCYHANGIGNNNEYKIFLETIDEDGFLIQKKCCRILLLLWYLWRMFCKPYRFGNWRKTSS